MGASLGRPVVTMIAADEASSRLQGVGVAQRPLGLSTGQRYRCGACGNLTRFDVESAERVRRFWHLDLSGEGYVEETVPLEVAVRRVTCRWCGTSDAVEVVAAPGSAQASQDR